MIGDLLTLIAVIGSLGLAVLSLELRQPRRVRVPVRARKEVPVSHDSELR